MMTPTRRSDALLARDSTTTMAATAAAAAPWQSHLDNDPVLTNLLHSIASKQSCLMPPAPCLTLTMYISTSSVGAVIGRKGQSISQLQTWASRQATTKHQPVRISVMGMTAQQQHQVTTSGSDNGTATTNADSTTSTSTSTSSPPPTYTPLDLTNTRDWTPLVIRADPKACLAAAWHIYQTVPCDDVVLDVPLSRTKHATVVGKRGILLANASADFNVRIMVPAKQNLPQQHQHNHNIIQLEGDLLQVMRCLDRLLGVAFKAHKKVLVTETTMTATGDVLSSDEAAAATWPAAFTQTLILPAIPNPRRLRCITRQTETMAKTKTIFPAAAVAVTAEENAAAAFAGEETTTTTGGDVNEEAAMSPSDDAVKNLEPKTPAEEMAAGAMFEYTIAGATMEAVQAAVDLVSAAALEQEHPSSTTGRRRKHNNRRKMKHGGRAAAAAASTK